MFSSSQGNSSLTSFNLPFPLVLETWLQGKDAGEQKRVLKTRVYFNNQTRELWSVLQSNARSTDKQMKLRGFIDALQLE